MVDFPSAVAVPPTSAYGPPQVDFSWLANLANQYAQGQKNAFDQNQRQRTLALQQPIDATNTQDVLKQVLQRGGAQYAEALLPFMLQQEQMKAASAPDPMLTGGASQGPTGNPPPASASGVVSTNMKTPVTQPGGDAGSGTITDIVTGQLGNTQDAGATIAKIAGVTNIDPNAPLSQGQQVRVAGLLKRYAPQPAAPAAVDPLAAQSSPAARVADAFAAVPDATAPAPQPQQRAPIGAPAPAAPTPPAAAPAAAAPVAQPAAQQPTGPIGPHVPLPKGFTDPEKAILALRARAGQLEVNPYALGQAAVLNNWADRIEKSIQPLSVTATSTIVDPRTGAIIYQGPAAAAFATPENSATLDADAERYRQTGTLPPNMGRGVQGQQQATAIRARAAELESESGGDPAAWPTRWQQYRATGVGLSQAERTKAVREENLKLILKAANAAIPAALEQSEKVSRTGFVPLNKIIQRGQIMTSDPELRAFGMANLQLAEHWARAMNPTGVMRESDRDLALQFLSTADSQATYRRLVSQLKTQIEREYKSIQSGDAAFGSAQDAFLSLGNQAGKTSPANNSGDKSPAPADSAGWVTLPNGNRIRQVQ